MTVWYCRESLMEGGIAPVETHRTQGLDNSGLVNLQRQIMKGKLMTHSFNGHDAVFLLLSLELYLVIFVSAGAYIILRDAEQDEDLENLEKTVHSTKHIALAVNEELDLHTRLLVRCYLHTRPVGTILSSGFFCRNIYKLDL